MPKVNIPFLDKVVHFFLYAIYGISIFYGFNTQNKTIQLVLIFYMILFGVLMEICQETFTEYRTFEWNDIVANSIGAFFGWKIMKRHRANS
jgi:VanZ family protein